MNINKQLILDEIERTCSVFQKRSNIWYSIRCPMCGDSEKDPTHSHCYIVNSDDPTVPLIWHCFLCNKKGRVNDYFLKKIGVKNKNIIEMASSGGFYNKFQRNEDGTYTFDKFGEVDMESPQVKYIEHRLGKGFTLEDYNKFRIIDNIDSLRDFITKQSVLNTLPSNKDSISFLSDDSTMLLTRSFQDFGHSSWNKIRIRKSDNTSFYTIKATLNLFTKDPIIVNIGEGVFDVLSIYKNFNEPNSVFIAALGSNYVSALEYMIHKGFVGRNVIVKVYIDQGIDEKSLRFNLAKYKWMFDNIIMLKNSIGKDVGVKLDAIRLITMKI